MQLRFPSCLKGLLHYKEEYVLDQGRPRKEEAASCGLEEKSVNSRKSCMYIVILHATQLRIFL